MAWGFVQAGPACWLGGRRQWGAAARAGGWHSGLAARRNKSAETFRASARARNLIRGERGCSLGWGRRVGLRAAVCVHGNLRACTGGFPII